MAEASANSSTYPRTGRVRTTMIRTGTSAPPFESFRVLITHDSYRKVRAAVRKFTDEYLTPNALEWDEAKEIPAKDYRRVAESGILAGIAAAGTGWLHAHAEGIQVPGGIDPNEWDVFHSAFFWPLETH